MDLPIRSPWLHQLPRKRQLTPLGRDSETDIAVIGGGIAGIATAYFILRDTDRRVAIVEADRVAHGATGHNAGQLVPEFERSFSSLIEEFGMDMASNALKAIESGWPLLEQIIRDEHLEVPIWRIPGYGALSDRAQILDYLADYVLRTKAGVYVPRMMIASEWLERLDIPAEYEGLYKIGPQSDLLALCEAKDPRYFALYEDDRRGCMNSALFCEQLARAMLEKWPERFRLYEMSPVQTVVLHQGRAQVRCQSNSLETESVVLCTNGFEGLRITDDQGIDINSKFHKSVRGTVGYMAAFLEPHDRPPMANWYQDQPGIDPEEPYFYMTRRPYDMAANGRYNLLGVGGPETPLPEEKTYHRLHPFQSSIHKEIDAWMQRTYANYSPSRTEDAFFWHGLMGYTENGIRIIGPEPCNPVLLYNLGCNGIGLLHSIYGGSKIAQIVAGTPQEPSIFDPLDKTCPV